MDCLPEDFVSRMRRTFIRDAAAYICLHPEGFETPADVRAEINSRYAVFGVVPVTDAEFTLLLALVAEGPLMPTSPAGAPKASGRCYHKETTDEP